MTLETIVLIPNYNGEHFLEECLNSLKEQVYKNFKTVIADDGSTDDSIDYVRKKFPEVEVIALNKNFGFAKAVNAGLHHILKKYNPSLIAVLNNDTKVDKNWLLALVERAKTDKNIAAVTSNMFFYDRPEIINSQGGAIDWNGDGHDINIFLPKEQGKIASETVLGACWGASLIRAKALSKIGFLDDRYGAYYEDLDWGWRANILGYKIFFEKDAIIYHKWGMSYKNEKEKFYLNKRNALASALKNYELKNLPHQLLYIFIGHWFFILDHLIFGGAFRNPNQRREIKFFERLSYLVIPLRVVLWNFIHLDKTIALRNYIQKHRKVNDEEILALTKRDETPVKIWLQNLKYRFSIPILFKRIISVIKRPELLKLLIKGVSSGLNIFGYLDAESGVGEAGRVLVKAVQKTSIPYVLLNNPNCPSRKQDKELRDKFTWVAPYPINLIVIYGDTFADALNFFGREKFINKYNIAYWAWELSRLPDNWITLLNKVNEVWTPSSFSAPAIKSAKKEMPVTIIPHAIEIKKCPYPRTHFKLPKNIFLFLFMFDFLSIFERKNPSAVVRAFKKAFDSDEPVGLVIKSSNCEIDLNNFRTLEAESRHPHIYLINNYLDREEINSLLNICDCYVSLHRSEGFGLTIAEAMALGKPVIATNYSGNVDFMTEENSFPVNCKLVKLKQDYGPYLKGNVWAEPDEGDAVKKMRLVYENREVAARKGMLAARDIASKFSPEAIGRFITERLKMLQN